MSYVSHRRKNRLFPFLKKQSASEERIKELFPFNRYECDIKSSWVEKYKRYLDGDEIYTFYDFNVPNFQRKFEFEKRLGSCSDKKDIVEKFFGRVSYRR